MNIEINHNVFFEKILPSDFTSSQQALVTTQKRLALQDALSCKDNSRIMTSVKDYLGSFNLLLSRIRKNSSNLVLREQPQFDWSCGKHKWMSTCWQWEKTMIHATCFDANIGVGMEFIQKESWKEASTSFNEAAIHAKTIQKDILPQWSWKSEQTIPLTFSEFWSSKLYFACAMNQFCTLQFGMSKQSLSDKNSIKLLNRIEHLSNISLSYWVNEYNKSLMNWSRVCNALIQSQIYANTDQYGKALGLLQYWTPVYKDLKKKNSIPMSSLLQLAEKILLMEDEWKTSNENIHYQTIETPEITYEKMDLDIINKIKTFK